MNKHRCRGEIEEVVTNCYNTASHGEASYREEYSNYYCEVCYQRRKKSEIKKALGDNLKLEVGKPVYLVSNGLTMILTQNPPNPLAMCYKGFTVEKLGVAIDTERIQIDRAMIVGG